MEIITLLVLVLSSVLSVISMNILEKTLTMCKKLENEKERVIKDLDEAKEKVIYLVKTCGDQAVHQTQALVLNFKKFSKEEKKIREQFHKELEGRVFQGFDRVDEIFKDHILQYKQCTKDVQDIFNQEADVIPKSKKPKTK